MLLMLSAELAGGDAEVPPESGGEVERVPETQIQCDHLDRQDTADDQMFCLLHFQLLKVFHGRYAEVFVEKPHQEMHFHTDGDLWDSNMRANAI